MEKQKLIKQKSILEDVLGILLSEHGRERSGVTESLLTEEGRQLAIKGIFGRSKVSDTEISEHRIEETFRVLERRKSYLGAASLSEELGMESRAQSFYRQALEKYERSGDFAMQGHCLEKLGQQKDAEVIYKKAAKQLAQKGHFAGAAKFAELAGLPEAREYHENAANLLLKEGRYVLAYEHAEKANNPGLMHDISKRSHLASKADTFEDTGTWTALKKAKDSERENMCRQFIASYESAGDFVSAARISRVSGSEHLERMAKVYSVLSKMCTYNGKF